MKHQSDIETGDIKSVTKVKNIFYFIGILGIGFLIIYCLASIGLQIDKNEVDKIKANASETVGEIIKIGSLKGSYAIAEYYVNNIRYERKDDSPANDIYIGEYYKVLYNTLKPAESRIDYTRPVFLKDQKTEFTTGRVIYTDWAKLKYSYSVNGIVFNRFQKIPEKMEITKNQIFNVEYLIINPKLAILKIQ